MNERVVFLHTLTPLALAAILAVLVFLFLIYRRFSAPASRRLRTFLLGLRILVLLMILFILLEPFWNRISNQEWIGLLVDVSGSMNVRDGGETNSRIEILNEYFEKNVVWRELQKKSVRAVYVFDDGLRRTDSLAGLRAGDKSSRLLEAFREINHRYDSDPNLLGWLLFSDGNATDDEAENRNAVREAAFPWVMIRMGREDRVPNLKLLPPDMPEEIYTGEKSPFKMRWESTLPEAAKVKLEILLDGKPWTETKIQSAAKEYNFEMTVEQEGNHSLDVRLVSEVPEASLLDNDGRFWFRVLPRTIRVLQGESFYKPENRLKQALEEDKSFQVHFADTLLGFARKHGVAFIQDPIYGFPRSREQFLGFDAVVLSDVKKSMLTPEQISWIRELVEQGGGALVMIGGIDSFGDGGYAASEIDQMLPVEISEEYKKDVFLAARGTVENSFRPVMTPGAENHPLLRLSDDPDENVNLWKTMPLLGGYNYVGRLKPAATLLLQHPLDRRDSGPRAILAVHSFGRGKVMAFTSDVSYNWGQWFQEWRTEDGQWRFAAFWQNALKWLTENRLQYRLKPLRVDREPFLLSEDSPAQFSASCAFDEETKSTYAYFFELWREKTLFEQKEIRDMSQTVKAVWNPGKLPGGDYLLKVRCTRTGKPTLMYEMPFTVHPSRVEADHLESRKEILEQLSQQSQGRVLAFAEIDALGRAVKDLEKKHLHAYSFPYWNQWWIYLLIVLILGLDWFLRKRTGLE